MSSGESIGGLSPGGRNLPTVVPGRAPPAVAAGQPQEPVRPDRHRSSDAVRGRLVDLLV